MAATPTRPGCISIPCKEPRIRAGRETWMMNPLMVAGALSGNFPNAMKHHTDHQTGE